MKQGLEPGCCLGGTSIKGAHNPNDSERRAEKWPRKNAGGTGRKRDQRNQGSEFKETGLREGRGNA